MSGRTAVRYTAGSHVHFLGNRLLLYHSVTEDSNKGTPISPYDNT